jgi:hypothetical protein
MFIYQFKYYFIVKFRIIRKAVEEVIKRLKDIIFLGIKIIKILNEGNTEVSAFIAFNVLNNSVIDSNRFKLH